MGHQKWAVQANKLAPSDCDLAKKVVQVHGVNAERKAVVARKLRRNEVLVFFAKLPPCFR